MSESTIKIIMGIQRVPILAIKSLPDHDLIKEFGFNFLDAQHLLFFSRVALLSTVVFLAATMIVYLIQGTVYDAYFKCMSIFLILSLLLAILSCQLFRYRREKTSVIQRILRSRGL